MPNRTQFSNDVITGGKFVQLGSSVRASKQQLVSMNAIIHQTDISATLDKVNNITSDNVITSSEKLNLRDIWDDARSAYFSIQDMVNDYRLTEDNGWISLQSDYSDIDGKMSEILSDIDSDSTISTSIGTLITGFISKCSDYSLYLAQYATGVSTIYQNYSVIVTCNPETPNGSGNTVLTAHIYDQDNFEQPIDDDIEATIKWNFQGTGDDAYFESLGVGSKTVTISPTDYPKLAENWDFDVWVGISFPLEQLS